MLKSKTPLRIYVAGPYTGETDAAKAWNVGRAIDVGIVLYMRGHYPLIPQLTHHVALQATGRRPPLDWDDYMRCDLSWLTVAEAMFFIGPSRGADIEHREALKRGMKIYYEFDEVPFIPRKYRIGIETDNKSNLK